MSSIPKTWKKLSPHRLLVLPVLPSLLAICSLLASPAHAQPRSTTRQSGPQRSALTSTVSSAGDQMTVRRVRDPHQKTWFTNYFAEFTGPSADFALPLESYSPYSDYWAPMALYQSLELGYVANQNNRLGLSLTANKPLQSEVLDKNYNYYSAKFTFFDPSLFLQSNNLLSNSWSWVNTRLSVDLPMSDFAKTSGKITTFYIGPVWNFRLPSPKWYFSLNLDLYYNLYSDPQGWNRFSSAAGQSLGYYFSPRWHVDATSIFDFAFVSQGQNTYTFTTGSVDRMKITLRYQPILNQFQIGFFAITPVFDRGLDRTALGINSNLWF